MKEVRSFAVLFNGELSRAVLYSDGKSAYWAVDADHHHRHENVFSQDSVLMHGDPHRIAELLSSHFRPDRVEACDTELSEDEARLLALGLQYSRLEWADQRQAGIAQLYNDHFENSRQLTALLDRGLRVIPSSTAYYSAILVGGGACQDSKLDAVRMLESTMTTIANRMRPSLADVPDN